MALQTTLLITIEYILTILTVIAFITLAAAPRTTTCRLMCRFMLGRGFHNVTHDKTSHGYGEIK
nr:MAG TPA: hypothetical protein [Caudoviricetes sp.]